jgi:hypothetical protein
MAHFLMMLTQNTVPDGILGEICVLDGVLPSAALTR